MKHLWKFLSLALICALILATLIVPAALADEVVGGRFNGMPWEYNPTNATLAINGQGALPEDAEKPWQNYEVQVDTAIFRSGITEIPDGFMNYCINMTTIMIPASVTRIGEGVLTVSPKLINIIYEGDLEALLGVDMSEADRNVVKGANFHKATVTDNNDPDNPQYTYVYDQITVAVGDNKITIDTTVIQDASGEETSARSKSTDDDGNEQWVEDDLIRSWRDEEGVLHKLYQHSDSIYGSGTHERVIYSDTEEVDIYTYPNAGLVLTQVLEDEAINSYYEYSNPDAEYKTIEIYMSDAKNGIVDRTEYVAQDGTKTVTEFEDNKEKTIKVTDASGNLLEEDELENGDIVKQTVYNEDGSYSEWISENEGGYPQTTLYDSNGNKKYRQVDLGKDGKQEILYTDSNNYTVKTSLSTGRVETTVVTNGNRTKLTIEDPNAEDVVYQVSEFNSAGQNIKSTLTYKDDTSAVIEYNDDGSYKSYTIYDAEGNEVQHIQFEAAEQTQPAEEQVVIEEAEATDPETAETEQPAEDEAEEAATGGSEDTSVEGTEETTAEGIEKATVEGAESTPTEGAESTPAESAESAPAEQSQESNTNAESAPAVENNTETQESTNFGEQAGNPESEAA